MRVVLHNAGIAPERSPPFRHVRCAKALFYKTEGAPSGLRHVDARAAREVATLKNCTTIPLKMKFIARPENTGVKAIPRSLWLAHHRSDIYRQASTITMIQRWLAYMLSGELAVDPSNAGTTDF
ncbi:FGGY family carbohydrate kinase [Shigella flexneri]